MTGLVQLLGWIHAGASISAYRRNDMARLRSGWRTLKLGAVPFYILNFIWSSLAWGPLWPPPGELFSCWSPSPSSSPG